MSLASDPARAASYSLHPALCFSLEKERPASESGTREWVLDALAIVRMRFSPGAARERSCLRGPAAGMGVFGVVATNHWWLLSTCHVADATGN